MEEKQAFISRETEKIFREWSARAAVIGAVIFLFLSLLDFSFVPALAVRFLGYRIVVAAFLAATAAGIRRSRRRVVLHLLVYLGVLVSAVALEAMIMGSGGHHSPYLIGQILLAVVIAGLIPSGAGFASLSLSTIFVVYLVPILLWDTVSEREFFAVNVVLFSCVLASGVLVRWFHQHHLVSQISLRHDLMKNRKDLELEIAQRRQSDIELRNNQELLSSITAAAMDAIVLTDPEGLIRYWNPAATAIFGYTAEEALGRSAFSFLIAPEKAEALQAGYRAWQTTGTSSIVNRRIVSRGLRKSGESFPMDMALTAVPREGRLWCCALLTDISERAVNEERLGLFAAAVESAAEGIFIADLEGRIVYSNSAAAGQLGYSPAELIGRDFSQLHRDPAVVTGTIFPALRRDGRWAGEASCVGRGGQTTEIWLVASLARGADGSPIAFVGLSRDLADQKRLEAGRLRTQKIESVGVLAGGLAHDFNNLLTIILGNLDLARLFAGSNPDAAEALDHASEAALRAGDLTRQLITFSKGGHPTKRVGNVARTLRETVVFAAAGTNLACEFAIPENLPRVDFDEGQIRQVFHNLVQNAREAMPDGGTLRVSASAVQLAGGEIPALAAGRYLRLEFTDSGTGIADEHLTRIFDPYFSTKEMDSVKGRGLGLAVSYSIVRNHGGTITADSRIGNGTTIAVYLPETTAPVDEDDEEEELAAEPPVPAESASERIPDGPPRGRVLVMDDEPLVGEMAGTALRRLGFAATLCHSSAEAVVQYQIALDSGGRFDVAILDLTVPGGPGGPETLARLREIDPTVRAVLSSGYADHPAVNNWAGLGFAAFIAKPYSLRAFEELLAQLA